MLYCQTRPFYNLTVFKLKNGVNKKGKANTVTGCESPSGHEMLRLPYFLDNQPTDGDEVVSFMRQPPFTLRKTPGIHFC
jgi:hypothetical protein